MTDLLALPWLHGLLVLIALIGVLISGVIAFSMHIADADGVLDDVNGFAVSARKWGWTLAALAFGLFVHYILTNGPDPVETVRLTAGLLSALVGGILCSFAVRNVSRARSGNYGINLASALLQKARVVLFCGVVLLLIGLILVL